MIELKQTFSVTIEEYNKLSYKDTYSEEVEHELKKALGEKILQTITEGNGWPYAMISNYQFTMECRGHRMFFTASICFEPLAPSLTFKAITEHVKTVEGKMFAEEDY